MEKTMEPFLASRESYKEAISLYGSISEFDQDRRSLSVNTVGGRRISGQGYSPGLEEDILKAFAAYRKGQKVLLEGIGLFSPSGNLSSLESIGGITFLDNTDFGYRLAEIGELKKGWLEGKGVPFDKDRLRRLLHLFQANYRLEKDPYLYPAQDDVLQAEWECGPWRISLEIDLTDLTGDMLALNLDDDASRNGIFDLNRPEQWRSLCDSLHDCGLEMRR